MGREETELVIGQLADPNCLRKNNQLFLETLEAIVRTELGYANPVELAAGYPAFLGETAHSYIEDGLRFPQEAGGALGSWFLHQF